MMARTLSVIARRTVAYSFAAIPTFIAPSAWAEGEVQVTAPKSVVENPFASPPSTPRTVAEEPQDAPRGPVTYQNPFANMSKAPPVDKLLRSGPVSRWRQPQVPAPEPSVVKTAFLTVPSIQSTNANDSVQVGWNEHVPGENIQARSTTVTIEASTRLDHLADPEPIIRSIPTTLAQPDSVASASKDTSPLDFQPPLISTNGIAHATCATQAETDAAVAALCMPPVSKTNKAPSVDIFDHASADTAHTQQPQDLACGPENTPEAWLHQAQEASSTAETPEELTTVIGLCDHGIQVTPPVETLSSLRQLSAWAHNRRGETLADAQRPDDAIQDFQAAISMDPNCSLAIHNRGVTFAQRNQFAAALRDFNRVIELNPGLAVAYRNRAELLAALGRMEESIADYNQAITSLPEDPSLFSARAHAHQRLGDYSHAAADLKRAIEIAPHDAELITQRGSLFAEQGKFEQARNDFRAAIALDAKSAGAYRSLAWLQATCADPSYRDPRQAIAYAEKAAKLLPEDDYLILDTLAAAQACSGKFDRAIDCEEKAITAAPRDLSTPLENRLALYQRNKTFTSSPARDRVRTVSHEAPAQKAVSQATATPSESPH